MNSDYLGAQKLLHAHYSNYDGPLNWYQFTLYNLFNLFTHLIVEGDKVTLLDNLKGTGLYQDILTVFELEALFRHEDIYEDDLKLHSISGFELFQEYFGCNIREYLVSVNFEVGYDVFETINELGWLHPYREALCDECIQIFLRKNKNKSDALQPRELTELMQFFIPESENKLDLYNPFAGFGSIGLNHDKNIYYQGEDINEEYVKLTVLRFFIHGEFGDGGFKTMNSIESLYQDYNNKHDIIIFNPPLNVKLDDEILNETKFGLNNLFMRDQLTSEKDLTSINEPIVSLILDKLINQEFRTIGRHFVNIKSRDFFFLTTLTAFYRLKENGRLIFIAPDSFLEGGSRKLLDLRKFFVEKECISHIIKLPNSLFSHTSISGNLIVIQKSKTLKTKFIDARNFIAEVRGKQNILDFPSLLKAINSGKSSSKIVSVNLKSLGKKDYKLNVSRYVKEELKLPSVKKKMLTPLHEIILPDLSNVNKTDSKYGKYIKNMDLAIDEVDFQKDFEDLEERKLNADARLLEVDCLLVSLAFKELKPTIYEKGDSEVFFPRSYILPLLVNLEIVDKEYLVLELQKEYVVSQLKSVRTTTGVPRVSKNDFLNIRIVVPSLSEQIKEVIIAKNALIKKKQSDFENSMKNFGIDIADENSFLRHQIAGTLKNVRSTLNAVQEIIEKYVRKDYPEILNLKRDPNLQTTFSQYIDILERDVSNIQKTVLDSGNEISLTQIDLKPFNLLEFLRNYVQELKTNAGEEYKIELNLDQEYLEENQIKTIMIEGDKVFLRRAFNNIVENAVKHGFRNVYDKKNKIEVFLMYNFENQEVEIDFGNNGESLPENFSLEDYTRRGSSVGINAGDGTGGWYVNQVIRLHNGKVSITNETRPKGGVTDLATSIEITLPMQSKL